jgi:hypothetical protein
MITSRVSNIYSFHNTILFNFQFILKYSFNFKFVYKFFFCKEYLGFNAVGFEDRWRDFIQSCLCFLFLGLFTTAIYKKICEIIILTLSLGNEVLLKREILKESLGYY